VLAERLPTIVTIETPDGTMEATAPEHMNAREAVQWAAKMRKDVADARSQDRMVEIVSGHDGVGEIEFALSFGLVEMAFMQLDELEQVRLVRSLQRAALLKSTPIGGDEEVRSFMHLLTIPSSPIPVLVPLVATFSTTPEDLPRLEIRRQVQ